MEKRIKIAIDGPSGTGKSSIAKQLAKKLDILHLDTGAMYRAVTYYFIKEGLEITEQTTEKYLNLINIEIKYLEGENVVYLNGRNITKEIRSHIVSSQVSLIAKIPLVREKLTLIQQEIAQKNSVVMDGRDIASIVMPDADLKLFLTTNDQVRALRRVQDFKQQGQNISLEQVMKNFQDRDLIDSKRETNPLVRVPDAILLDTSDTTAQEAAEKIMVILKEKKIL